MRTLFFCCLFLLSAVAAQGQEENSSEQADKGYLTNLLQDALSGAGRSVEIDGFQGALSSRATIERMTIADDEGIWLTIEGVVLDWNRTALLRGRLEVAELSADRMIIPRGPVAEDAPALEAAPFSIPELPVSVDIAKLVVARAEIGASLLGQDAVMRLTGAVQLDGRKLNTDVALSRLDGKEGEISLLARYDPESGEAGINITMRESADGIAANWLNIPDKPALELSYAGEGNVTDLTTRFSVTSNGKERLGGNILLMSDDALLSRWQVDIDLAGDITPLFAPEMRDFFGEDVKLAARAARDEEGAFSLTDLSLTARAANITGDLVFSPAGWPRAMQLRVELADPSGAPVVLPTAGTITRVSRVDLTLDYDENAGQAWQARAAVKNFDDMGFLEIEALELVAQGTIVNGENNALGAIDAQVRLDASGPAFADPALARAIGTKISGQFAAAWMEGAPLSFSGFDLSGADFGLSGDMKINEDGGAGLDLILEAEDLSRFGPLVGVDLTGAAELGLKGTVTPLSGAFDLVISGDSTGLALGQDRLDALLAGSGKISLDVARDENGIALRSFEANTPNAQITAAGTISTTATTLDFTADIPSLTPLFPADEASGAAILSGKVTLAGAQIQSASVNARLAGEEGGVDAQVVLPLKQTLRLSGGNFEFDYGAEDNVWKVNALFGDFSTEGYAAEAFALKGTGRLTWSETGAVAALNGKLAITGDGLSAEDPNMAQALGRNARIETRIAYGQNSPLSLEGVKVISGGTMLSGDLHAEQPLAQGPLTFDLSLSSQDIARFSGLAGMTLSGMAALEAKGSYDLLGGQAMVLLDGGGQGIATGNPAIDSVLSDGATISGQINYAPEIPLALNDLRLTLGGAEITGSLIADTYQDQPLLRFDLALAAPDLGRFSSIAGVPLRGATQATAKGSFSPTDGAFGLAAVGDTNGFGIGNPTVDRLVAGQSNLTARVARANSDSALLIETLKFAGSNLSVEARGTFANLKLSARLADIALITPDFSGPLTAEGTVGQSGSTTRLDITASAPGDTELALRGTLLSGQADLAIRGDVPLGLANVYIAPRRLNGRARIDLKLTGTPAVEGLSGTVQLINAEAVAPTLNVSLEDISGGITLNNGQARLDVSARGGDGGRIGASGTLPLTSSNSANLTIQIRDFILQDSRLYRTSIGGTLLLAGPLSGGTLVSGKLTLGVTEIRIPSSDLTALSEIPEITHIGSSAAVRNTQKRAGLIGQAASDSSGGGSDMMLNITLSAPRQIFVRGRGLDAELGGELKITGTTSNIVPSGAFNLVRGRLDMLSKRFQLTEGDVQLTGSFDARLRFTAITQAKDYTISIIIEGSPSDPKISFVSAPDLPQDEILALLIFGNDLTTISPLQALELANAVAVLAGKSSGGLILKLRQNFGLDDLDVSQSAEGTTAVRAGKYLSENVYSSVEVDSSGTTELNLNLELTPNLTVKGSTGSDGNSGLGIFFEKDY